MSDHDCKVSYARLCCGGQLEPTDDCPQHGPPKFLRCQICKRFVGVEVPMTNPAPTQPDASRWEEMAKYVAKELWFGPDRSAEIKRLTQAFAQVAAAAHVAGYKAGYEDAEDDLAQVAAEAREAGVAEGMEQRVWSDEDYMLAVRENRALRKVADAARIIADDESRESGCAVNGTGLLEALAELDALKSPSKEPK